MMMHVSARAMARPVCVCACDTVARPASPCSFGACFGGCACGRCARSGTVCARFRGGASAVCLFPFRRRAGHDPVNRAGCSASGRCSRSGTWARDYGQAFFCPTTRNIACNIVITDLSPGCRAVELSSCRESVEPLSRPLSRGCQGLACRACQVAVE